MFPNRDTVIALGGALLLSACDKGSGSTPPGVGPSPTGEWPACTSLPAAQVAPQRPGVKARVYTDVTLAMGAFAGKAARSTPLEQLHRTIDKATAEAGSPQAERWNVGVKWECAKWMTDPPRCEAWKRTRGLEPAAKPDYGSSMFYGGFKLETAPIDRVLVRTAKPVTYDADKGPVKDPLDEAELSVVVSSGLEPGALTSPAGVRAEDACKDGPSPGCITRALVERAAEGYGVWLVAITLPFDGKLPLDVAADKRFVDQAAKHLKDIKEISSGERTPYKGVSLKVGGAITPPDREHRWSTIDYAGVKPLLVFALTRNAQQGRQFVATLTDNLRRDPTLRSGDMTPEEAVVGIELAPLALAPARYTSLAMAPAAEQTGLDPGALAEVFPKPAVVKPEGVLLEMTCGANGKAWFAAAVADDAPQVPLPSYVKRQRSIVGPIGAAPLPEGLTFKDEKNDARFGLNCSRLQPGAGGAFEYRVHLDYSVDAAELHKTPWGALSADDAHGMPERAYGIETLVGAVLSHSATVKNACVSRARVHVQRMQ